MYSSKTPVSTAQVREGNRCQVLEAFLDGTPRSAGDVAEQVGLSRQTVMKSIQFFLRTGLLESVGKGDSTSLGGKRPELFGLTRKRYFLSITIWPGQLRLRLTTVGGSAVAERSLTDPLPPEPRAAMDRIGRLCAELVGRSGVDMDRVAAVSVSTAGILDYRTGTLRYSSQSPQWGTDVPIQTWLQPRFAPGTLIFAENAGKMAARPFLREPELERKRVMVIFACWGLSATMIEAGEILSGSNSLIGEIGHMIVEPSDPEVCGCGSRGCLERLVSIRRLRELARSWAPEHPGSVLVPDESLTVPRIFEASAGGDGLAMALSGYLAEKFALALRNVSLSFDPDVVVFQGDYANADRHFRDTLRGCIGQLQYFPPEGPFELRFDDRDLAEMDAEGAHIALSRLYFSQPELYMEA